MKTPEEMSDLKVVDLLGYKYAKKAIDKTKDCHAYDAFMYQWFKSEQQKRLMLAKKNTTKIEWTSVSDRLPSGDSKQWYVVVCDFIGSLRTIGSSQFINGEWLQIREGLVLVTHWADMPEELP